MTLPVLRDFVEFVCVWVCERSVAQSCLIAIPWTIARQAPLSMEFSGQEYWRFLSPGDFP